jgi:membrane-associated phospholipid phosphatase
MGDSILHSLLQVDTNSLIWINKHHSLWLDAILAPVAYAGETAAVWILVSVVFLVWGKPTGARATALALLAAMIIVDRCLAAPLAHFVHRERPYMVLEGIRQMGIHWTGNSFPSGHAHSVWVATIVLSARWRKLMIPLIIFALLTCYSRPYFGMHYPGDVIVGSVLGAAGGTGAVLLQGVLRRRRDRAGT